ncbi:hypothetical protein [Mesorhizobium sp.]
MADTKVAFDQAGEIKRTVIRDPLVGLAGATGVLVEGRAVGAGP